MSRYRWMLFALVLVALVLVALVLGACSPVPPPHPGSYPNRILFIGTNESAFNEGLDKHLSRMALEAIPPLYIDTDLISISPPVQNSWQDSVVQNVVKDGEWDVVVVEGEFDRGTQDAKSYAEYVRSYDELIRSAGARPVLLMDWQYDEARPCIRCPEIDEIESVVTSVGSDIDAKVAPAGIAWERAMAERPQLELYSVSNMHENDPSGRGTYLATAVLFAVLFDRSPVGNRYRPLDYLPDLDTANPEMIPLMQPLYDSYQMSDDEAEFLQRVAWETVQEYQK